MSCVAPTQCHLPTGACIADGGCVFSPRTGLTCDAGVAGTCNATFGCVANPTSLFPYAPSNFTESQLPSASGGSFVVNCNATIDTSALTISGNCATLPPSSLITPDGGEPTVLFRVDSLFVRPAGSLTITGGRPVIFAVTGDLSIEGVLTASNAAGTSVACGNGGAGNPFGLGIPGGAGGGALQLSVAGNLVIDAVVNAPGRGPVGGMNQQSGGGGGGSGGAILLEGRTVTVTSGSVISANGGGGSEGGSNGQPGSDGLVAAAAALGGAGGSANGGNGGNGAAASTGAQDGQPNQGSPSNGAGGAGGGVGRIRINASLSCSLGGSTVITPPASSNGTPGCP